MIALACPHGDLRDCHACLEAAHQAAAYANPSPHSGAFSDEQEAEAGFRLLCQIGLASTVTIPGGDRPPACVHCGAFVRQSGMPCPNGNCPGRRPRFQPPEVR